MIFYINTQNELYVGDMATGDRLASVAEIAAWELSRLPTYQQQRAPLYPPPGDGLDAMVKGGQAWEDYKAACLAVKALIPKPAGI